MILIIPTRRQGSLVDEWLPRTALAPIPTHGPDGNQARHRRLGLRRRVQPATPRVLYPRGRGATQLIPLAKNMFRAHRYPPHMRHSHEGTQVWIIQTPTRGAPTQGAPTQGAPTQRAHMQETHTHGAHTQVVRTEEPHSHMQRAQVIMSPLQDATTPRLRISSIEVLPKDAITPRLG
jgi:hypothetical protein